MNNISKVRIYDLSKELNLDNKQILDICEQLNISVKSHSSTITEEQAETIRATAEKQYPHGQVVGKGQTQPHSEEQALAERKASKQEILAIHHRPNTQDSREVKNTTSSLAQPPRAPVRPQMPSVPLVSSPVDPVSAPAEKDEPPSSDNVQNQEVKVLTPPPQPSKPNKKEEITEPLPVNNSKMLTPPSRPSETPKGAASTRIAKEEKSPSPPTTKPILSAKEKPKPNLEAKLKNKKPERTERTEKTERTERPERAEKAEKPERVERAERTEKPTREKRISLPDTRQEKPEGRQSIELMRPNRPKPPQKPPIEEEEIPVSATETEQFETVEVDEDGIEKPKQKPKLKQRPAPPKTSKRKDWEEEDDEKEEAKGKLGKVSKTAKNKRRSQLLLEDEDDFETELEGENLDALTNVSLSTARPPKPKSTNKAPAATPPVPTRTKKPAAKSESSARLKAERNRKEEEKRPEVIALEGSLTVRELAARMKVAETDLIKNLFMKSIAVSVTQTLDVDTIKSIAGEFGVTIETLEEKAAATKTTEMLDEQDLDNLQRRPPVVTIMGHVDHGKTTLLDSIRKTKVAQGEAGGITQHIGAYHVDIEHNGKPEQIVFLDTPGHEAFTAMRARGARVTDIAVLVVAADDGVQPQTREAVSHAKAAEVPIVVAINKIDKQDANPDRLKQELSELGLVPEEWGGDVIMVPVSALRGENLDTLLEMILLVAEVQELSANPNRPAKGTVIEAHLDRSRGPVATFLVQNGTLRVGDVIVAGSVLGKIRAMVDDRGDRVEAATPSFAVEVIGISDVPAAGDEFDVYPNEKEARAIAEERSSAKRHTRLQQAMSSRRISLSTISAQAQEGQLKELNLILKADVQGSVEAIMTALNQLPQKEVQIRLLLAAPGEITETDVALASASGAVIVGFNTTLASGARSAADQEGIDIREYNIIYKLLDDIQGAMEGLLDPEEVEEQLGTAEVRVVFPAGRGFVAGCYILSGKVIRNRQLRVRRHGEVIFEGVIDSLKRFTEDAREVNAGYECGIGSNKFNDWKPGDIIEAFEMVMKRRTLSTR